jgi:choline kinase
MTTAIILAAGGGTRLKPLTDAIPKCQVELHGRTLIDWQVDTLTACGVTDIVVVKGCLGEKIRRPDLRYYENPDWATTNMVSTLWCAKPELNGEVVVSYGDIVYNRQVLSALLACNHDMAITIDLGWESYWRLRFNDPLEDAESLRMSDDYRILNVGSKVDRLEEIQAQYMGLLKFSANGAARLKRSYRLARERHRQARPVWGNGARSFENLYMTDMLQGLIDQGESVYGVPVERGWFEIDTPRDYEVAQTHFNHQMLM